MKRVPKQENILANWGCLNGMFFLFFFPLLEMCYASFIPWASYSTTFSHSYNVFVIIPVLMQCSGLYEV